MSDGARMTLEEAIEHAKRERIGDGGCAEDHAQLAEWLEELQAKREDVEKLTAKLEFSNARNNDLFSRLNDIHEKFRKFRRDARVSPDGNVHIRVQISTHKNAWVSACKVSQISFENFVKTGMELISIRGDILNNEVRRALHDSVDAFVKDALVEEGDNIVKDAVTGFLSDLEQRPWEL